MVSSSPILLADIDRWCQERQWGKALDAVLGDLHPLFLPDVWRSCVMSETRLFLSAGAAALQQGDTEHAWCAQLAPGQRRRQQLQTMLHPRRITYAADMIRAAGLALTARSLTPVAPGQSSALYAFCTWVDEDVAQGSASASDAPDADRAAVCAIPHRPQAGWARAVPDGAGQFPAHGWYRAIGGAWQVFPASIATLMDNARRDLTWFQLCPWLGLPFSGPSTA
jgi:hypothetical protein